MKKVICFGGSFNPIHKAHFEIAKKALKASNANECWFIVSLMNPFKKDASDFEKRAQLIEIMIKDFKKFKVCRIESELETPSYTINTLRHLKKRYPDIEFSFLIGSDQAVQFNKWKEAVELIKLVDIYVYRRDQVDEIPTWAKIIEDKKRYLYSSTAIRNGDLNGLDEKVLESIMNQELYLESLAQSLVSSKRFKHIQAMTKLALSIATAHHLNLHQVYLAALFHDCAKSWSKEKMIQILNVCDPNYLNNPEYMWHARCGAYYAKKYLMIKDQKILNAIQHHVHGRITDPLTLVIYIADKCDETRGYDASEYIELAYKDLKKAYLAVKKNTHDYISERKAT